MTIKIGDQVKKFLSSKSFKKNPEKGGNPARFINISIHTILSGVLIPSKEENFWALRVNSRDKIKLKKMP